MPIVIGLADECENAADFLELYDAANRDPFPRAANLLRAKAEQLRKPKGKRKRTRTVQACVGKRRSKGNEIRIKADRISDTTR